MSNQIKGMNILVCGSQHFDDQSFVSQTLDQFYSITNENVRKVFTSKFSGACEFAKNWVIHKNDFVIPERKIALAEFTFDGFLEKKNISLYDNLDIPETALQNSKFFQEGKNLLISEGVNLVLAFPNKDGILGASTKNVTRFANLAKIEVFDCAALLSQITKYRDTQAETLTQSGTGFHNRHPVKR